MTTVVTAFLASLVGSVFSDMNEALKVKGVAAWTAMGQDPAAWDTAIVFYG